MATRETTPELNRRGPNGLKTQASRRRAGYTARVSSLTDRVVEPELDKAVAKGDLSQTMAMEHDDRPLQGEFLRTANAFKFTASGSVTFRAMKGDRDRCLEAGASDYLSKPVDPAQLLALLSQWSRR